VAGKTLVHNITTVSNSTSNTITNHERVASSAETQIFHPNPQVFKQTAWLLSPDSLKQNVFLDGLEIYPPYHGELAQGKIILAKLGDTIAGVVKGKYPNSLCMVDSAEVHTSLFYDDNLQNRTSGYRSMLSAVLPPIENVPVGQHPYLI
jgi:hypothetical protein